MMVFMWMGTKRSEGCHENQAERDKDLNTHQQVLTLANVSGGNVKEKKNLISISCISIVIGSHT